MAATNKAELLDITQKEFRKLGKVIGSVDPAAATRKDENDTSIKDVIAHRAHWIDLFVGWHADGQAGKKVYFPAKGYKWNDLKRYNADLQATQADLDWDDAVKFLQARYEKLLDFINTHSDEQLYAEPMKGANNAWPTGRWAEAAGPSHFRSAAKYLRARLKALA
ncbi:ClbS/DfsB family four-helix bundle protein [Loktanella sp. F6476L]|uniref:ClbS/DfsB family four-helix bundle protein n=1 Tax=Loktanella sp. F6476L TaxID=2926405 RepID=UPI001FF17BE1|nr:ClbS/DfsB family four-helix bundle protein [Loktanella sp. F6476L]MCK0120916.1 ClbS/DfsB family four-helix bundle protein [Loktanella sp. F6476L]